MALFSLSFFVVLVGFVCSLLLAIEPVKKKGIINLIVGVFTLFMTTNAILDELAVGEVVYVIQLFYIFVSLISVYCILRADGIGVL